MLTNNILSHSRPLTSAAISDAASDRLEASFVVDWISSSLVISSVWTSGPKVSAYLGYIQYDEHCHLTSYRGLL